MNNIEQATELGQSFWLNYLRRGFIESGELRVAMADGIQGITSTPLIFAQAITHSADYDPALRQLTAQGVPVMKIYEALITDDIQRTADILHPIFEESQGADGYVTLELDPALANDSVGTIATARHLLAVVNRANVMIEIPATPAGIEAIERLTSDGVNTNATHIFSLAVYEQVAQAYLRGIEDYVNTHSVWRQTPASVASISISRIDRAVDPLLRQGGRPDLQGRTGLATAKAIYMHFRDLFSGMEWEKLARRDAQVQRPKWTRTTPRDLNYPDTYYINALIGPDTVQTLSAQTWLAFKQTGLVENRLDEGWDVALNQLTAVANLNVNLEEIGNQLQTESLVHFHSYFQELINSVSEKRQDLEQSWQRISFSPGSYKKAFEESLAQGDGQKMAADIWREETAVLPAGQNRSWLHLPEIMQENVDRLDNLAQQAWAEGYRQAIFLGSENTHLAPALLSQLFPAWHRPVAQSRPQLDLYVFGMDELDNALTQSMRLDLSQTLFIFATLHNNTARFLTALKFFKNRVRDSQGNGRQGNSFVAVTTPHSRLADLAQEYHFREIFFESPDLQSSQTALSFTGLLPAVLAGAQIDTLLTRTTAMAGNSHPCNSRYKGDNLAYQLSNALLNMAQAGRNQMICLASPGLEPFSHWAAHVLEEYFNQPDRQPGPQITGRTTYRPTLPADDHFFLHLQLAGDATHQNQVARLQQENQPVITYRLKDAYDLGGLFFTWQMALTLLTHRWQQEMVPS